MRISEKPGKGIEMRENNYKKSSLIHDLPILVKGKVISPFFGMKDASEAGLFVTRYYSIQVPGVYRL